MQQFFPGQFLYGGDYNPEQWSEAIWREDMRLMQLAHVNMVSINIFSWASLEPQPGHYHFETLDRIMDLLAEYGISVDLATATASPPTWMSQLYPAMLPVTREGVRLSHGSRQHYCPNSADFRRKSAELVQRLAARYADHPALKMWHLNNEYGCHVSQCFCDTCADAFRSWLQQRYTTLESLNTAWGTNFWSQYYYSWDDILPPRISPAQINPGQMLDYWHFMSDSLLGCYEIEEKIIRSLTPDKPLTTNFIGILKAVDYFSWSQHLDVVSFDMYPANTDPISSTALAHDLMRSLKGQPHMIMEQSPSQVNWMPQNPQKRPGRMRLHALQALAHGANGVMFFQWRQSQAGAEKYHAAVVTHDGNEHTRIFRQVAQVGAELERLAPTIADSSLPAKVALLMDWQAWWAVEYLPGPSDRLHYLEQMAEYYQALHSQNVAVDIVAPDADLGRYSLVVAPMLHLLRPGVAKNLEGFVAQGGTFLTNFFSGIVDEHDHIILLQYPQSGPQNAESSIRSSSTLQQQRVYPTNPTMSSGFAQGGYPGGLRELLGIHVEELDPFTPEMHNELLIEDGELAGSYPSSLWGELVHLEGARALGIFASDYYAQQPALTVNQFGEGQAYYLATQSSPEFLAKLLQHLCQQAGVEPVLTSVEGVEATKRVLSDGRSVYFLLNHNEQVRHVTLPVGTFTSLLSGKAVIGSVELAPVDAEILLAE